MMSGLNWEATFPVPDYMLLDASLPDGFSYDATAAALAGTSEADGRAQILRAEAMRLAGVEREIVLPVVEQGLSTAPGSTLGWIILAELEAAHDRERAGKALALALKTAPYDYRFVFRRARLGTALWQLLPAEEQDILFRQSRFLFTHQPMRQRYLNDILLAPGGPELMGRSFAGDPEELRALNRFIERRRRTWTDDR